MTLFDMTLFEKLHEPKEMIRDPVENSSTSEVICMS